MKHNLNGKEIALIESQLKGVLRHLEVGVYDIKEHIQDLNMDCDVAKKGDHDTDGAFKNMNEWRDVLRKFQVEKKTIVSILTKLKQQKKTQC
jgi:hypothetical protein